MNSFGNKRFLTGTELEAIRARVPLLESGPMSFEKAPYIKWNNIILNKNLAYQPLGPLVPFTIPQGYSDDPEARSEAEFTIKNDVRYIADFATAYAVTQDESYAENAARLIDAYTLTPFDIVEPTPNGVPSHHVWCEHWLMAIQAVMLINESVHWTVEREEAFVSLINRTADSVVSASSSFRHTHNIFAWFVCYWIAAGGYAKNARVFGHGVFHFKDMLNNAIQSNFLVRNRGIADGERKDNIPMWEIYRQGGGQGNGSYGLLYSNAAMNPIMCAVEYARLHGVNLLNHETPDGSTIRGLYENVLGWNYDPSVPNLWFNTSAQQGNPQRYYWREIRAFDELAYRLWPSAKQRWLLERWLHAYSGYDGQPTETYPDTTPGDNGKGIRNAEILIRLKTPIYEPFGES